MAVLDGCAVGHCGALFAELLQVLDKGGIILGMQRCWKMSSFISFYLPTLLAVQAAVGDGADAHVISNGDIRYVFPHLWKWKYVWFYPEERFLFHNGVLK